MKKCPHCNSEAIVHLVKTNEDVIFCADCNTILEKLHYNGIKFRVIL